MLGDYLVVVQLIFAHVGLGISCTRAKKLSNLCFFHCLFLIHAATCKALDLDIILGFS